MEKELFDEKYNELCAIENVSRETFLKIVMFESLINSYSSTLNLISRGDLKILWKRHVIDSAQLFKFIPNHSRNWLDIGSGCGFPSVIISILAQEKYPNLKVFLVESNRKKSTFLEIIKSKLNLNFIVMNSRVEDIECNKYDVISARAFANFDHLLSISERFCHENSVCVFPKGVFFKEELKNAMKKWKLEINYHDSISKKFSWIIVVKKFQRKLGG